MIETINYYFFALVFTQVDNIYIYIPNNKIINNNKNKNYYHEFVNNNTTH